MDQQQKNKAFVRIPLTLVSMLLMQACLVLVWATQLDARVNGMEQQVMNNRTLSEKFARLEERLDDVRQGLDELKRQIEYPRSCRLVH